MNPFVAITTANSTPAETSLEGESRLPDAVPAEGESGGQTFGDLLGKEQSSPETAPGTDELNGQPEPRPKGASSVSFESAPPTHAGVENLERAVGGLLGKERSVESATETEVVDGQPATVQDVASLAPLRLPTEAQPVISSGIDGAVPKQEPEVRGNPAPKTPRQPRTASAAAVEQRQAVVQKDPVRSDRVPRTPRVPATSPTAPPREVATPAPRREIPVPNVKVVASSDSFSQHTAEQAQPDPVAEPRLGRETNAPTPAGKELPLPSISTARAVRVVSRESLRPLRESSRQEMPVKPAASPARREVRLEGLAAQVGEAFENDWKQPVFEPQTSESIGGMPVAIQDEHMSAKASTANEFPLPITFSKAGSEKIDLRLQGDTVKTAPDADFADTADLESDGGEFFSAGSKEFRDSIKEESQLTKTTAAGARFREAARETVLFHALQLKDLGRSHLDVSFRPDEDTLITLHLQTVNGEIIVEGRLDQGGNQDLLNDWNRMQRSLARDGVQLRNLDFNQQGQREGANQRREQDHPSHQPGANLATGDFVAEALAADAAPFPGVAANMDHQSTWQAWG